MFNSIVSTIRVNKDEYNSAKQLAAGLPHTILESLLGVHTQYCWRVDVTACTV